METNDNFYNDGLEIEKEGEIKGEKRSFDPIFAIIFMQCFVVIAVLVSVLAVKQFFPKEGEKIKAFYKEKVMAETNVELVLEEALPSNG